MPKYASGRRSQRAVLPIREAIREGAPGAG